MEKFNKIYGLIILYVVLSFAGLFLIETFAYQGVYFIVVTCLFFLFLMIKISKKEESLESIEEESDEPVEEEKNHNKEFISVFQITRMIMFEVDYYTLSTNKTPHFTTSAEHFIRSKRDFDRCGQCQDILPIGSVARKFWEKWDDFHLKDLDSQKYAEMCNDLQSLKDHYNYIYVDLSDRTKPYSPSISFNEIVELSKRELKK